VVRAVVQKMDNPIYHQPSKSYKPKRKSQTSMAIPFKSDLTSIEKIDSIPVGGSMSIWNIKLDSGYEEVIFAESYNEAYLKAEHNENHPEDKSNGFEIFYSLAKDIREIRDDLARIKKVIKLPSEDRDDPYF
jgi:hypothetical protein|tara:strand:+ start:403 stop:798 length:396 start_codon:yes stop_codon:yes gene_type:complete